METFSKNCASLKTLSKQWSVHFSTAVGFCDLTHFAIATNADAISAKADDQRGIQAAITSAMCGRWWHETTVQSCQFDIGDNPFMHIDNRILWF